jgi:hypothetical protein
VYLLPAVVITLQILSPRGRRDPEHASTFEENPGMSPRLTVHANRLAQSPRDPGITADCCTQIGEPPFVEPSKPLRGNTTLWSAPGPSPRRFIGVRRSLCLLNLIRRSVTNHVARRQQHFGGSESVLQPPLKEVSRSR